MHEKLKEIRLEHKMSQLELAEIMGVSRSCISSWETGTRKPNLIQLGKYLIVFKLKNNYFNPAVEDRPFTMGSCFDITTLNCEGLKKLYDYYTELMKDEKYLKKF